MLYFWILYPENKPSNYITRKNFDSFWNCLVVNFLTAFFYILNKVSLLFVVNKYSLKKLRVKVVRTFQMKIIHSLFY